MYALVLIAALASGLLDRTAVIVDRHVITLSEVDEQLRVTAFLNRTPLDRSPAQLRRTAERLVEQVLLRNEMQITGYKSPLPSEALPLLKQLRTGRPDFAADLKTYGIDEAALERILLWQLATIRFIELRFRPGSAVGDSEVALHYRENYVPEWQRTHPAGERAPELDDVRERIEAELLEQKVELALDAWLRQAREQARVRFVEEAFGPA
ncbi:MAG: hypothetical protein R2762_19855 [Bryobacteraceae bacterium]